MEVQVVSSTIDIDSWHAWRSICKKMYIIIKHEVFAIKNWVFKKLAESLVLHQPETGSFCAVPHNNHHLQ